MAKFKDISTEICRERLRELLSIYVGQGKKFSVEEFTLMTGFEPVTIKKIRSGEVMPCAAKLLKIMLVVGEAHLVNGILELADFTGASRISEASATAQKSLLVASEFSSVIGMITKASSKGRATPQEELAEAEALEHVADDARDLAGALKRQNGR